MKVKAIRGEKILERVNIFPWKDVRGDKEFDLNFDIHRVGQSFINLGPNTQEEGLAWPMAVGYNLHMHWSGKCY